MKLVDGMWLPSSDTHFPLMMRKAPRVFRDGRLIGVYQFRKLTSALALTKKRRVACDIGAHVGYFSLWLADEFREVIAFEPVAEHAECFKRNVTQQNVTLHCCAVGEVCGMIRMETDPENSGKARVAGSGNIPMIALDDMRLEKVDFAKIDVEGAEGQVIAGAAETIQRCRPVMIVEQNNEPTDVQTLKSMGMVVREKIGHDYILSW